MCTSQQEEVVVYKIFLCRERNSLLSVQGGEAHVTTNTPEVGSPAFHDCLECAVLEVEHRVLESLVLLGWLLTLQRNLIRINETLIPH
jgi:hypothetical protein